MTTWSASGDCGTTVILTQGKGSSFPVNTYTVAGTEVHDGSIIHLPHDTASVTVHEEFRWEVGGPVVHSADFTADIKWESNCVVVTTTTTPATTTTVVKHATTTTTPLAVTSTTVPRAPLPPTGRGEGALLVGGTLLLVVGVVVKWMSMIRHHTP